MSGVINTVKSQTATVVTAALVSFAIIAAGQAVGPQAIAEVQAICIDGQVVCASLPQPTTPTPVSGQPSPTATRTPQATPTQVPTKTAPALTATPAPTIAGTVPPSSVNLLRNPGFEFPFNYAKNADGFWHLLPASWQSFYCDHCPALRQGDGNPQGLLMGRPEYKSASYLGTAGREWLSGATAAQWFCFNRACRAGVYQVVAVSGGVTCEAKAWVRTWSNYTGTAASEVASTDDRANSTWFIRVHPYGGTDWKAQEVLVSQPFGYTSGHYDAWAQIAYTFSVPKDSTSVAVFFENVRLWPIPNNDNYVDGASLRCTN